MKFAVCFCIHLGELELKALLLAASLRKHWPSTVDLVACVPKDPQFGGLSNDAARILHTLGVRLASTFNPIGADYPIANKLPCLDVPTDADRIVFLDSDIMALASTTERDLASIFGTGFVAKPADTATFKGDRSVWQPIYQACGAVMPDFDVFATTSGETMAPYFNAGVIGVDANSGFGRLWSDCAGRIDKMPNIPLRRPHLDQIALPVTVAKLAAKSTLLDENWNFPTHLRPLPPIQPRLSHYHWPEVIEREPALLDEVADLVSETSGLAKNLGKHERWCRISIKVTPRRKTSRTATLPVGVITGIPRSGTSYLCQLLYAFPDHVVINEPKEIFAALRGDLPGHTVACFYRDLRRRILDGEAVENKIKDGTIIADTAKMDVRSSAPIAVGNSDFMLWTKNTLAYLNRLPQLLDAMPDATFVACVRHPVDTIESWARTFPHLRDADVERFPVGYPSDPWLSPAQRDTLDAIAACTALPQRRAMLWNYLADIVHEYRDRLIICRLEDLAENPSATLNNLTAGCGKRALAGPFMARESSHKVSAEVLGHIAGECTANAARLGYLIKS